MPNLTSRGPTGNNAARLPALAASTAADPQLRAWQEGVREWLEVRLGARGDYYERAVTFRDLNPLLDEINRRLTALENEAGASVEDCCKLLRAQVAALWAYVYSLQGQIDVIDLGGKGGDLVIRHDVDPKTSGDPYWSNVVLLVQDGTDAGTAIQDRSLYASTATINDHGAWDSAHKVGSANMIHATTIATGIGNFTSSGLNSRFGRVTGDKWTIECFVYWSVIANFAPSGALWAWYNDSGLIMRLAFEGDLGDLKHRNGTGGSDDLIYRLTPGVLHFVQVNIDNGTYTIDIDGVQRYTGTNIFGDNFAAGWQFQAASFGTTGSASGGTTNIWSTPLRVTKGVARPRGTVPTAEFGIGPGATTGGTGNATWASNSSNADLSTNLLALIACSGAATSGIAVVSAPNGVNTVTARSGKVYLEFAFDGSNDDMSYVGLLANSSFTGSYPTASNPFGMAGLYAVSNITDGSHSPGTISNGTLTNNILYDFTATTGGTKIGIAWDTATGKVWISKDGAWVSGNPATGTSPTFTLTGAAFTFVAGNYLATGTHTGVTVLNARAGRTTYAPPSGFTWYA